MDIHDFDMARYLYFSDVDSVYARGAVLIDPGIGKLGNIDAAITTLALKKRALGVIDNSQQPFTDMIRKSKCLDLKVVLTLRMTYLIPLD